MWIWQQKNWPNFEFNSEALSEQLAQISFKQGLLLGQSGHDHSQNQVLDNLLESMVQSSAIEGEAINPYSLRSSLATKLGVNNKLPIFKFHSTPV